MRIWQSELHWHFSSLPQQCFSGGCTIPFVLIEDWPLGFDLEWGGRTTQTLLEPCDQHHVAQRRLDRSEEWTLPGEKAPQRKQKKGTKKGLRCKLFKRKKIKSSLAILCAIYSVAHRQGPFQLNNGDFYYPMGIKMPRSKIKPPFQFRVLAVQTDLALLPPWRP